MRSHFAYFNFWCYIMRNDGQREWKLSTKAEWRRNGKSHLERKIVTLLKKGKQAKKKENKNIDQFRELEIELVKIKYVNNHNKLQSELEKLKKIQVVDLILHENENDIFQNITGESEMVGTVVFGENSRKTHFRFRKINHYLAYFNSIDQGYESEDSVFNSCLYRLNTPQFNIVNRSQ